MRLVVFHYHDRPGGVRQVISRGLPRLVERLGRVAEVILLMGEMTDPDWVKGLEVSLAGVPLRVVTHRELGYLSGRDQALGGEAVERVQELLSGQDVLVWAHNLSVGRNVPLLRHLPDWCASAGARLWLHHHDWWWDGRWARWADWQASGIADLEEALELSIPTGPHLRHWCVNQADLAWLQTRAGASARWVGNPLPELAYPDKSEVHAARAWLQSLTQGRRLWLAPVRALRRKNLAEALLLAQQQDEPTCLVTTGGPSSPAEVPPWEALCAAAARHHWPLVPAVLAQGARICNPPRWPGLSSIPSLTAILSASDAIAMPSLQEGFGLPYLEAAALEKPLLARALPDVSANLNALGCALPGTYNKLPVAPGSFNAARESIRLAGRWALLRSSLPEILRMDLEPIQTVEGTDFGCLSLEAQMEVLQSSARLPGSLPEPQVPFLPAESREDHWADRFFQAPAGSPLPSGGSLLAEVRRRFHYWQQHPLLWP
ncbi:MAG: glycosyltransferase [Verrucomicrobiota bacterium]